ncbi:ABC transporter ATP-binding protein [Oceanibacterium hippocampi]|uniref:Oligopeptide transport ATP-binding protein OppF n=1 Tax=Oceanibacterium hippocampi TaxID=745714 RepID=A0A1Y5TXL9_9PROT|nr:oligopeptide/dipeptide ABC transporter ATP-binding protein [Oceanibacterium hippocampi]SLN76284.1 Oligopeptide transport ATP-binding protein OppF [Oceanibacterium hippocampi]
MSAAPETGSKQDFLRVEDLKVHFRLNRRLFAEQRLVHAVDGVSFSIRRGTTFGLVGESGSGKSTTAFAIMRLVKLTGGRIDLDGIDLGGLEGKALREMRRRFQIIFQDPYSSLNPRMRAGAIVREPMDLMAIGNPEERDGKVAEIFRRVGLRPEQQALFPHQFSGGQRQRIGVARALSTEPDLIVCDEPVSALDVAIQAQILNLLRNLQRELGLTYLFISHDLGVVQYVCDEVAVMYLGRIVEQGDRISLFGKPLHPYTWALLSAVPSTDPALHSKGRRIRLVGDPPSPIDPPAGCRFVARCPFAVERCHAESPRLRTIHPGHSVACHLVDDDGNAPHHRLD